MKKKSLTGYTISEWMKNFVYKQNQSSKPRKLTCPFILSKSLPKVKIETKVRITIEEL